MDQSSPIYVRLAQLDDAPDIVSFNQAMAMETENKVLPTEVINAGVRRVFSESGLGFYVVAQSDESIVGTLMVTKEWSDWRDGLFWWIQSVYVLAEFRGRGVYRAMYQFIKKQAQHNPSVCGFRLYVEKNNHIAKRAYQALGMNETHYLLYEQEV